MDKNELIKTIKMAFIEEKYPGDHDIVYDNSGQYLDVEETRQNFSGKLWHELDNDFLFYNRDGLFFFSKNGFKYYLPAFMIAAIKDFNEIDEVPDIVIGQLLLPDRDEMLSFYGGLSQKHEDYKKMMLKNFDNHFKECQETFFKRVNEFNIEQCKAIKLFLEYMEKYTDELYESHNPKTCLERYWKKYEKSTTPP